MKILLTGGSGYIGSSVIKRLGGRFSFASPESIKWVNFDIKEKKKDDVRNLSRLLDAVKGVDGVVHLAAISRPKWGFQDPLTCLDTNIRGTFNVLEAVRLKNPKAWVILGSSREVFGNLKYSGKETSPRNPRNAYAVSKCAGEDLLKQYAENYGLSCLTIRFCGVYTGRDDILDRVIPRFINQARRGAPITIEGDGKKKYDFVYIDDAVDGIARAIRFISSKPKGFYDDITLSRQKPTSLLKLAKLIMKLTRSRRRIIFQKNRSYDQDNFWGSFAKAKRLLGWSPKISLHEGLIRSIEELKPIVNRRSYIK